MINQLPADNLSNIDIKLNSKEFRKNLYDIPSCNPCEYIQPDSVEIIFSKPVN